ncbi:MAG: response regulator, partial [Candidatus Omnitrophica bacterium]|nr:response regulator [Candidatus Omnitrophota bacterium]
DTGVPHYFFGDPTAIRQILINLASNAIKFTEHGLITLAVSADAEVEGEPRGVRIAVRDTGIGIPADKREVIFEKFVQADNSITRKYGGTGLGLAIVQSLVRLLGGTIDVKSEEGRGSEFTVFLKLREAAPPGPEEIVPIAQEALRGKTALIVDDNAQAARMLSKYCESLGIRVLHETHACDGAFAWLENTAELPDLILSDIMMPGMDGYTFATRLKTFPRLAGICRVAISSEVIPGSAGKARDAGFDAYLAKPVIRSEFAQVLATVLGERRAEGPIITRHLSHEVGRAKGKVLVVEDNPVNQKLLSVLLHKIGCDVDLASEGQEGVDKALVGGYDLILMDIQMPVLSGIEATKMIRLKMGPSVPILAITAAAMKAERELGLAAGMNDYLTKPVDVKILKEKVLNWISRPA